MLKAARSVAAGQVIAVVQPHRYTRLRDLFDEFCACFNDADTVHRGAGLSGRRGADRGHRPRCIWSRACACAATATPAPLAGPEALAADIAGAGQAGRLRRLPRRRLDQPMGQRAAGATGEARRQGLDCRHERHRNRPRPRHHPRSAPGRTSRAAPCFESEGVTHMALFGSRARGDNRPDSDVDLLIDIVPGRNSHSLRWPASSRRSKIGSVWLEISSCAAACGPRLLAEAGRDGIVSLLMAGRACRPAAPHQGEHR